MNPPFVVPFFTFNPFVPSIVKLVNVPNDVIPVWAASTENSVELKVRPAPPVYSVFVSVDAISIPPSELVIVMFVPAVSVPTDGPLVPPIKSSPDESITAEDNVSVPVS